MCGGDWLYGRAVLLHRRIPRRRVLQQTEMGALLSFSAAPLAAVAAAALRVGRFAKGHTMTRRSEAADL
jgi:hypothetical protein